ncbi:Uncharacterised protein [Streptococcus pneumoniae]|jgi:ribosomal protein L10|uniref:hypothetical protein n=1 Tax=Streptococcus pneumoniae TaxID=1313 RepID=UPI00027E9DDC|nr:hypothetical protein [Streptococcus pneumoniae]CCM09019.1 hypothetical protein SPNA45_01734 [Streptococcus pneumoniae SPNA45]MDG7152249.1 hypothetical protein [Streptococcus pneumoniae]MDG7555209.1 hypothetical protein [Streptococcus pneumoniae]MDG7811066.1 hypothetical protein [Streptococcus pneumoniae]MDG8087705.1 hypothetical protein [Streptococcus pneumoniae]
MAEFQVRVSSEAIYYFEELKKYYTRDSKVDITRSQILTRAFEETKVITNWTSIINDTETISLEYLEYQKGYGTNVKVQISEEVEKGIRELKILLPNFTATRSVTFGVAVKFMLKGAIILNKTGKINTDKNLSTIEAIEELKQNLQDIVAPINYNMLENILDSFKNNILLIK